MNSAEGSFVNMLEHQHVWNYKAIRFSSVNNVDCLLKEVMTLNFIMMKSTKDCFSSVIIVNIHLQERAI